MNMQVEHQAIKNFSWKGVLVGALIAFGLLFLFNLLTIGGGLSAYTKTEHGLEVLIVIAYLWIVVGSFLALFIAGLVTSMIASNTTNEPTNGIVHGFVTWVIYILISLLFLSHVTEASIVTFPQNFLSISTENFSTSTETDLSETSTVSTDAAHSAEASNADGNTTVQKQAHKMGLSTLAAFFIFFVEAIACCFGAWCGIELIRKKP